MPEGVDGHDGSEVDAFALQSWHGLVLFGHGSLATIREVDQPK